MKTKLITIILLISLNLNIFKPENRNFHPIHLSFTTIEYFDKQKEYKILFKIFADDFELILNKIYNKNLKLSEKKWEKSYLKPINSYIKNNFKLTDNKDKEIVLKFENQEFKEQAIYLYYKAKHKTDVGKFRVFNKIMLDLYPDQKNLLIFVFEGETKALKFKHNDTTKEIDF